MISSIFIAVLGASALNLSLDMVKGMVYLVVPVLWFLIVSFRFVLVV